MTDYQNQGGWEQQQITEQRMAENSVIDLSSSNNAATIQKIAPVANGLHVYQAINAVQEDIAKKGISKGQDAKNKDNKHMYRYRGIDDVYNALAPLLAQHKLIIFPSYRDKQIVERKSSFNSVLLYTTLTADFTFVSAVDGSSHTCTTYGEAMDSGDKGTNKAMSIAYKYACIQVFAIPTEGDNDPDATVHDPLMPINVTPPILPNLFTLPAPAVAMVSANGKPLNNAGKRVFSTEQFAQLVQSITAGQSNKNRFLDQRSYFYTVEQWNVLTKL